MLNYFLRRQDTDIALLQEVTHNDFTSLRGYVAIANEGIDKRGTAIITGVPLPTKPGSSLIIPKPMKILQRDLNRT